MNKNGKHYRTEVLRQAVIKSARVLEETLTKMQHENEIIKSKEKLFKNLQEDILLNFYLNHVKIS